MREGGTSPVGGAGDGAPLPGRWGPGAFDGGCFRPSPVYGYCQRRGPLGGGGLMGPYVFASSLGGLAGGRGGHLPGATGAGAFDGEAVQTTRTPAGSPGERPPRWGG
jgi:hypothetical protein